MRFLQSGPQSHHLSTGNHNGAWGVPRNPRTKAGKTTWPESQQREESKLLLISSIQSVHGMKEKQVGGVQGLADFSDPQQETSLHQDSMHITLKCKFL